MRFLLVTAAIPIALAGCTFDPGVPDNARVRCVDGTQCGDDQACDVETQLCVATGSEPPAVLAVELPVASSVGTVQLRIDANVLLAGEPVLAWTPVNPGFTFDRVEGASAFFSLVVDDAAAPADGFYTLASARLTSAAGIERTVPLASSLHIDRVAPSGSAILFHASFENGGAIEDIDGPFTERAGRAELFAVISVDEAIRADDLQGRIDGVSLLSQDCLLDASGAVACAFAIAPDNFGSLIDVTDLEVEVRDLAGNTSVIAAPATFDFRAPAIVPGSVAVSLLSTTGGDGGTRWSAGETLELSFVLDEDTPAPPVVTTDGPVPLDFELVSSVGRVFRYQRVLDVDPLTEVVLARATMSDAFGHASDVVIELPAPFTEGVVIAELEPSPCTFAPGGTAACVDLDDDGALGFQPGVCEPASPDCDDEDPLRGPGFREVRDDGVPNDCDDVAEPANDESNVVYLDPVDGDDVDDGNFFTPVATLARGLALARAQGKALYIAKDGALSISSETFDVDMVGGLDRDAGWTRTAEVRTPIDVNAIVTMSGSHTYAHLTLADADGELIINAPSTLLDVSIVGPTSVRAPSALVDVIATTATLNTNASNTRIHGGRFTTLTIDVEEVRVARAQIGALVLVDGSSAVVTNALLIGNPLVPDAVVDCDGCDVSLFHSVIRSDAAVGMRLQGVSSGRIVASVIDLTTAGAILLDRPSDEGLFAFADVVYDVDVLQCGFASCANDAPAARTALAGFNDNVSDEEFPGAVMLPADPVIDPNDARRILDTSPGFNLVGAVPWPGTPSTTAADFEGECRTAPIDAGADSR